MDGGIRCVAAIGIKASCDIPVLPDCFIWAKLESLPRMEG